MGNLWEFQSLYDLQFFNCPACDFKDKSKQAFVDHACNVHPESINYFMNVQDGSIGDIVCPWSKNDANTEIIHVDAIKQEEYENEKLIEDEEKFENVLEIDDDVDCSWNEIEIKDEKIPTNENESLVETNGNNSLHSYNCESCGKSFSEPGDLKKHVHIVHEGHKDYNCDSCGKSFAELNKLEKHLHTVHDGYKDYKCESCGKSFTQAQHMKAHILKVHIGA